MSGGERTEKATPKRKREQRAKGNVLKSHDLSVALQLLGLFAALKLVGPGLASGMKNLFYASWQRGPVMTEQLTVNAALGFGRELVWQGLLIMAPLFAFAVAAAILSNVLQTGFLLTGKTLGFKFERISPLLGFKRIFSGRTPVELLKSIAKITVVIFTVYDRFVKSIHDFSGLMADDIATAGRLIFDLTLALALRCGAVLLVLGGLDYLYQWRKHNKELRMTKQEVKEEYKQTEGNPQTRGRIRQIQRLMAGRRMMQDVPLADVVITNPTHFAVALRYDPAQDAAPVVLAKGRDLVAARIRAIARDNRVTLVENKPLAQSLYKMCKIGAQIPVDLYQAVAEVLAYVFRLKEGKSQT